MDVLAVRDAVAYAKAHCGAGNGPIYMEMKTYRYHGHSMSDPGITYRSRDEISGVRASRDPVQLLEKWLIEYGCCTKEEIKAIQQARRKEVDAAVEFAKKAPEP